MNHASTGKMWKLWGSKSLSIKVSAQSLRGHDFPRAPRESSPSDFFPRHKSDITLVSTDKRFNFPFSVPFQSGAVHRAVSHLAVGRHPRYVCVGNTYLSSLSTTTTAWPNGLLTKCNRVAVSEYWLVSDYITYLCISFKCKCLPSLLNELGHRLAMVRGLLWSWCLIKKAPLSLAPLHAEYNQSYQSYRTKFLRFPSTI